VLEVVEDFIAFVVCYLLYPLAVLLSWVLVGFLVLNMPAILP